MPLGSQHCSPTPPTASPAVVRRSRVPSPARRSTAREPPAEHPRRPSAAGPQPGDGAGPGHRGGGDGRRPLGRPGRQERRGGGRGGSGGGGAAVDAMRALIGTVSMRGVVVIGEGEKDEAPMLYNGEEVGDGTGG